ncbi:unnamed protein product, partial [Amoebophrya sp. A25]
QSSTQECGQELEHLRELRAETPREKTSLKKLCKLNFKLFRWTWKKWKSEETCVMNLSKGSWVFVYDNKGWLTSYTPGTQTMDFYQFPESEDEYKTIIEDGFATWWDFLDIYEKKFHRRNRVASLFFGSRGGKKDTTGGDPLKPLPSPYSPTNGLEQVFALALTPQLFDVAQELCKKSIGENGKRIKVKAAAKLGEACARINQHSRLFI